MANVENHFPDEDTAQEVARSALLPKKIVADTGQWDRFVLLMRKLLPGLAAVLALITMGWPLINNTEVSFTLSREEVAKSDDVILMQNLVYVGTLSADRVFRLEAAQGRQDSPTAPRIVLTDIVARMDIEDGVEAHVAAGEGIFHTGEDILKIAEKVTLETSNGYTLSMTGADVFLKDQKAIGSGPVVGKTPLGRLDAGRVEIIVQDAEGVFDGGVKMKIIPRRRTTKASPE